MRDYPIDREVAVPKKKTSHNAWLRNGNPVGDPSSAARCGARTKGGNPCGSPAMRGGRRCRLHGGLSTGPRTAEGRARVRQANTRHGRYSREQMELARE